MLPVYVINQFDREDWAKRKRLSSTSFLKTVFSSRKLPQSGPEPYWHCRAYRPVSTVAGYGAWCGQTGQYTYTKPVMLQISTWIFLSGGLRQGGNKY